ncbi:MAG: oligosaccharide flippase family protein, partial [Defluviitaleaceae bacterium]|nr:oligosaccharide flippase family protein [Defluviitaleaceae bacterium]
MVKKGIIQSAAILSIAALITRVLGFVYRIYISNIIGAEGMGLYQLIMPLYALAWSLACSGFTTTVSKFVSQENAKKEYGNMGLVLKQSLIITSLIGVILSVILFAFSDHIATFFFKDSRLTLSLQILSLSFPFMAAGSCIRGYFFGLQEAKVPAISQVLEQFVRMGVIYFLSFLMLERGLEYAAAVAVMGIAVG